LEAAEAKKKATATLVQENSTQQVTTESSSKEQEPEVKKCSGTENTANRKNSRSSGSKFYKKLISTTLSTGRFYLDFNLAPCVDAVSKNPESKEEASKPYESLFGHLTRTYVHSKLRENQGKSYAEAVSNV
jgi:hypothetical protein